MWVNTVNDLIDRQGVSQTCGRSIRSFTACTIACRFRVVMNEMRTSAGRACGGQNQHCKLMLIKFDAIQKLPSQSQVPVGNSTADCGGDQFPCIVLADFSASQPMSIFAQ